MKKKSNRRVRLTILSALFAAMIFALTFSVKIPMPGGGYIHLGDAMIYIGACILPMPFAILSAAIGGAMSDFLGGYTLYVLPTLIIKSLLAAQFNAKSQRILTKRNGICVVSAGMITVVGYYISKVVLLALAGSGATASFGALFASGTTWLAATSNLLENIIQAMGSAALFFVVALALDKIKIKEKIGRMMTM